MIGRDLMAVGGEPADRRAIAMTLQRADSLLPGIGELVAVPGWLRLKREDLMAMAVRAALFAIAPALANSIDGDWLRACADLAGEDAVDDAMHGANHSPGGGLPAVPAARLPALGFDLMRAALAPGLSRYLDWAPCGGGTPPAALARHVLAQAGS